MVHSGLEDQALEFARNIIATFEAAQVDTIVIIGGNPSYTAPADLEFRRRIRAVRERVYLTQYENETARDATWLVPAAHFLESWGDARAKDGTVSFTQPMIEPLYDGRTASEVLSALLGEPVRRARVRDRPCAAHEAAGRLRIPSGRALSAQCEHSPVPNDNERREDSDSVPALSWTKRLLQRADSIKPVR